MLCAGLNVLIVCAYIWYFYQLWTPEKFIKSVKRSQKSGRNLSVTITKICCKEMAFPMHVPNCNGKASLSSWSVQHSTRVFFCFFLLKFEVAFEVHLFLLEISVWTHYLHYCYKSTWNSAQHKLECNLMLVNYG